MRHLAAYLSISLDGFYEGPNQEFDFFVNDEDFTDFSVEQLDHAGALVFGRVTYTGMAGYWPSAEAVRDNPELAPRMNALPKVVISSTLEEATWSGTRIVRSELEAGVRALKSEPGEELLVLGSPMLTGSLAQLGLLDELRIMVNPVTIGDGKSLFNSMDGRVHLELLNVRPFDSGNVLLTYRAGRDEFE